MATTSPRIPKARPSYRLHSPTRKVTFSQTCEVIPTNPEQRQRTIPINRNDDDASMEMIAFLITILLPFVGCIVYIMRKNLRESSRRYVWAYRSLQLGTALSVLYSYFLCSFLHHFKLQVFDGDIAGFSYAAFHTVPK
ncbi:transmembrane protein [Babesia ovis]|uniref:Transmembrane protein n=1 Tax=Babesia ovis TaxID=5869 RepID=A0A9W5TBU8_BABOV|nr:transmembrane protein [Babesia ovis]